MLSILFENLACCLKIAYLNFEIFQIPSTVQLQFSSMSPISNNLVLHQVHGKNVWVVEQGLVFDPTVLSC